MQFLFGKKFELPQELKRNWKTGRSSKKMVSLGHRDNFEEEKCRNSDVIAMSSNSLAVGSPSGLIKMFNRKDLSRQKVYSSIQLLFIF